MQKTVKGFLSLCLAVAVCVGVTSVYGGADCAVAEAAYATSASTYYSGVTATSGNELLGQLHDLITTTHKTYTSYNDCRDLGPTTDPGLDGKGVLEFYTHETVMTFKGDAGTWNREHVWCQSLSGGLWGTSGGGSDMHHIRPSEARLNGTRGNNKYGEVSNGSEAYSKTTSNANSKLGGYVGGGTFEPLDNVKGDVARIVMYVYTHYNTYSNVYGTTNGNGGSKTFGTLHFTNVISASNETAAIKLLLKWNELDPVDDIERYRNEEVAKLQGNRNPFIDNENYADAIWGDGTTTPVTPPVSDDTLKSISLNATSLTLTAGQTYNLSVTPNPSTASANVTWTTSNSSVATVASGKVTAKAAGTATITATSSKNSAIKATATVTVVSSSSSETTGDKITITRDSFSSASGDYALQSWSAGGIGGVAFIYGGEKNSMQFNIKQDSHYLASTAATSAPIKSVTVKGRGTERPWKLLTSTASYGGISGDNPTDGNDHGTQTVTADGVKWTVGGNDTYFALVYALEGTSGAGYLESVEVEYGSSGGSAETPTMTGIAINPSAFSLKVGESSTLTATALPAGTDAEVAWASSNTAIATVSSDGKVTAIAAGTATITATGKTDSSIKATATLTVTASTSGETGGEDAASVQAFRNAVAGIPASGTVKERREAIDAAISLYAKLTQADKLAAVDDIVDLQSAIEDYNEAIKSYNEAAAKTESAALGGIVNG